MFCPSVFFFFFLSDRWRSRKRRWFFRRNRKEWSGLNIYQHPCHIYGHIVTGIVVDIKHPIMRHKSQDRRHASNVTSRRLFFLSRYRDEMLSRKKCAHYYVVSYVSNFLRHFAPRVLKAVQKNSQHFHSRVRLQDKLLLYVNSYKEL